MIDKNERTYLRELAKRVAEAASAPENGTKRELISRVNMLQQDRPVILIFPEGSWDELIPSASLNCRDKNARRMEYKLRQRLYYHDHLKDDTPIEKTWFVQKRINGVDSGFLPAVMSWGLQTERVKSSGQKGAYIVKPVLNTRDDIEKIAAPPLVYDEKTTQQNYELEADLFGDILDVKLRGIRHISFHIPSWYISFRGLEQMYLDFYSDPDFVHAVFKRFKEGYEKTIFEAERQNLLELNNDETYHASGGLGYTRELPAPDFDHRHVRLKDMWGSAESQEMSSVSPEMHRAFPFPYEKELLSHFGLTGYGCCEALHDKLDFVLSLPNIRRISISPWGDVEKSAGILGSRYIFSWKPNPTYISSYYNEEEIRNYLQDAIKKTRNCQLEILLKDTHTCRNEPERFEGWMKIARSLL